MVPLALRLHSNHLSQEEQTLVDVLPFSNPHGLLRSLLVKSVIDTDGALSFVLSVGACGPDTF